MHLGKLRRLSGTLSLSFGLLGGCGGNSCSPPPPPPQTFTISGTVSGLTNGAQVTLLNNGSDPAVVKTDGNFSFPTAVPFSGGADGNAPTAALLQASDGNFYGTTANGGANGRGALFEVTLTGAETVLYSFMGDTDGSNSPAALLQGSDGSLYGTTANGGASGHGTVFKVTLTGAETVLYSFTGGNDGSYPTVALLQGSDGNLYGTTLGGGAPQSGTVFKLTPAGVETVLYTFQGGLDGVDPANLLQGKDGNLYGVTQSGGDTNGLGPTMIGPSGAGTVFKITLAGVKSFTQTFTAGYSGIYPNTLIQASDGNLWGTTREGGVSTYGPGTLFELTTDGQYTFPFVYAFPQGDIGDPNVLIQGSDGHLYGTSTSPGTVFRF
jgi:uncharacterized repeat protein (TIGR03803 family)